MTKLVHIEGIAGAYAAKLAEAGVNSIEDLLEKGSTPKGREVLAEKAGVSGKHILEWVNHADLMRIHGVGSEYSDLLEEAGVDTIVELARRNSENLFEKLVEINEAKKLVRKLPVLSQVADWIAQAKTLPRIITY